MIPFAAGWATFKPKAKYTMVYGSYTTPYARFINVNQLKVWDNVALALDADKDWNDTDVILTAYAGNALTDNSSKLGGWLLAIPAKLPDGDYDVLIYDDPDGAPAYTDTLSIGMRCSIYKQTITEMTDL